MTHKKGIADPVHGAIPLTEIETRVIATRAFQRLRNVKQLGLAHMVFPGADYSRFSHCLGVCHIAGLLVEALRREGAGITDDEKQRFRLAGLLHDIGHYPFSHATEDALKNHFASRYIEAKGADSKGSIEDLSEHYLRHEAVGQAILDEDEELRAILREVNQDAKSIAALFKKAPGQKYSNLISSDLDADRLDYLMRTAHFTGLPYGQVDLGYLIANICIDTEFRLCFRPNALRTIEHMLLGRYFDYQQISFHKTVAGLELVLKDVLRYLLTTGELALSNKQVRDQIREGSWSRVDDVHVLEKIRLVAERGEGLIAQKARAVMLRQPPKQVGVLERLAENTDHNTSTLKTQVKLIEEHKTKWARHFGIDESLWYVWHKNQPFTSIGSHIPASTLLGSGSGDPTGQAVRILKWNQESNPITEDLRSILHVLSNQGLYSARIYVLIPPGLEHTKETISAHIRNDLDTFLLH